MEGIDNAMMTEGNRRFLSFIGSVVLEESSYLVLDKDRYHENDTLDTSSAIKHSIIVEIPDIKTLFFGSRLSICCRLWGKYNFIGSFMTSSNAAWPLSADPLLSPSAQTVVPVLGMHRSGTSLVTRILDLLGMELGWPLQPANFDNPKGFWEHRMFQDVNMQVLKGMGLNQDGYGTFEQLAAVVERSKKVTLSEDVVDSIGVQLRRGFMNPVWGYKDPRAALLWSMWHRIFNSLGYRDIRPVVVVREPLAVVQSLVRRGDFDGLNISSERIELHIEDIWGAYYQAILDSSVGDLETLIICQEDLLSPVNSRVEIARLAQHIGADSSACSQALSWIDCSMDNRAPFKRNARPQWAQVYAGFKEMATNQRNEFLRMGGVGASMSESKVVTLQNQPPADWSIYIVSPLSSACSVCFMEVAESLHYAFAEAGVRAPIVTNPTKIEGRPIVLGANEIGSSFDTQLEVLNLPDTAIILNLEQIDTESVWMSDEYIDLLRRFNTWDYSEKNALRLQRMGVQVERIVPIGHVKELERIPENVNKDIDVLFYGLMNERREAIVSDLRDRGLNVVVSTNLFGENRDLLISRSKVVLNVHYYEAKVLEMVRISYLLTNGCVVVSEVGVESDLESALTNAVAFAEYDKIVETCVRLSRSREVRDEFSKNARKAMRARPQLAFIRDLLEEERI